MNTRFVYSKVAVILWSSKQETSERRRVILMIRLLDTPRHTKLVFQNDMVILTFRMETPEGCKAVKNQVSKVLKVLKPFQGIEALRT